MLVATYKLSKGELSLETTTSREADEVCIPLCVNIGFTLGQAVICLALRRPWRGN